MRGKPGKILKSIPFPRITPADAGKTYTATSYGIYNSGSPPRMRGKPVIIYAIKIQVRITPADAGKTVSIAAMIALAWDHPRGCGENTRQREQPQQLLGSPPRMRGKLSKSSKTAPSRGITPADAGKTLKRSFRNQPFCSRAVQISFNFSNSLNVSLQSGSAR